MKFVSLDLGYVKPQVWEKIKTIKGITDFTLHEFQPYDKSEIIERIKSAELLTSRVYVKYVKEIIDQAPKLKAIFTQSVGYNHIDIDYARQKKILVYNTPKYSANAVAEFVFSLISQLYRNINSATSHVKAGGIEYRIFEGLEIRGKTIGVVGLGAIGSRIIEIARGYDMHILCNTKNPSIQRAKELHIEKFHSLNYLLKNADIIVIAVPLTEENEGMIGKNELNLIKKTAIIINT